MLQGAASHLAGPGVGCKYFAVSAVTWQQWQWQWQHIASLMTA